MTLPIQRPPRSRELAFTMIEIALCIAIIGFSLVAIIGVLPTGMKVQKDNREETIINHDAQFLIEAIRSGVKAPGTPSFAQNFDQIISGGVTNIFGGGYTNDYEAVGLLTQAATANVRAFSGSLAEKGTSSNAQAFAFSYSLETAVRPKTVGGVTTWYELSLFFRWPLLPNGGTGQSRKMFRTLVAGQVVSGTPTNLLFFNPQTF